MTFSLLVWLLLPLLALVLLVDIATMGTERRATALGSRDKRILRLPLLMPQKVTTWRIGNAGRAAGLWPLA